ncbi:hypothetical protein H920_12227 [Fukomys damarensis]|uniref:Uncharacterized protein n=1 Tax=Fukomys damarensis TaxID=885580 RepID=A0A091D836_FUKDA|nr:hypothetical protein H920_12227 [Fukomys damarensis]
MRKELRRVAYRYQHLTGKGNVVYGGVDVYEKQDRDPERVHNTLAPDARAAEQKFKKGRQLSSCGRRARMVLIQQAMADTVCRGNCD